MGSFAIDAVGIDRFWDDDGAVVKVQPVEQDPVPELQTALYDQEFPVVGGSGRDRHADDLVAVDQQVHEALILQFIRSGLRNQQGAVIGSGYAYDGAGPAADKIRRVDELRLET